MSPEILREDLNNWMKLLLQINAPTKDDKNDSKDELYAQVQGVLDLVPNCNNLIVIGSWKKEGQRSEKSLS